jgi:hypothetical protein
VSRYYDISNLQGDGKWTVIGAYRQNKTMIAADQKIVFSDGEQRGARVRAARAAV